MVRETKNIDMDKIVAAILTTGRLATVGGQAPKDYVQEYQHFLQLLKSPANFDNDEYPSGVSDTLAKGRKCLMPGGPKGERRPADVIGNAVHVIRIATGEIEDTVLDDGIAPASPEFCN